MKKILIVLVVIFTLSLTTGCYNYIELSDLGVVSSMLVDYDDEYKIKLELYDDEEVKIIEGNGKTFTQALQNAESEIDQVIYYQHMNTVFLTKDINIHDMIYYFLRSPDINNGFYLVYTEEKDIYTDDEKNMGKTVKDHLEKEQNYSFFEVINYYINKNKDLYLPVYDGEKIDGIITLDGKKFKEKIGTYDEGIIKILEELNGSNIYAKCDENYFLLKVDSAKTKYDVSDKIKVNVEIEANIDEYTCNGDTTKIEVITELEDIANKKLKKDINNVINQLKDNNTDLLGINTMINNKHKNLDKEFNNYDYEIDTNIHIYKKGLLLR